MSDTHTAPAGWYPEPDGREGQRWWDGTRWTEYATPLAAPPQPHSQQQSRAWAPYDAEARARVPEGTPVDTVWIWLVVALPILPVVAFLFWDVEGYLLRSVAAPDDPMVQLQMYADPAYLTSVVLGWAVYGVSVWFAYLDTTALRALGYPRRFHWAWTFLSPLIYAIGRSVVVRRQSGRGSAPMWVAIALNVIVLIVLFVWIGAVVTNVVGATVSMYGSI